MDKLRKRFSSITKTPLVSGFFLGTPHAPMRVCNMIYKSDFLRAVDYTSQLLRKWAVFFFAMSPLPAISPQQRSEAGRKGGGEGCKGSVMFLYPRWTSETHLRKDIAIPPKKKNPATFPSARAFPHLSRSVLGNYRAELRQKKP